MLADVMTVLRPRSATNRDGCGQRTRTLRMERDLLKKAAVFFASDGDRSR